MPKYIAAGQHNFKGTTYRFMVMQRFSTDLQKIFENAGKQFSKQTVYALALRMVRTASYSTNFSQDKLMGKNFDQFFNLCNKRHFIVTCKNIILMPIFGTLEYPKHMFCR